MIRKLLFFANLFVFLITATSLFAGAPIRNNKLVYFSKFNAFTSSYPVTQSASNYNSSLVSSASINYGGSGITAVNYDRTKWDIINASSTLDPATAPYVEYTIDFNNNVTIDLDRFVISGGGSNYSAKFELRWSNDNYATSLGLFSFGSDWQYKLSSVNLNNLSDFTGTQLKFRLYFYDTSPSGFNFVHSDTPPYPSLDGTPASYNIWNATATVWINPPPAIDTITPSSGAIGSTVVINGTDFTGATTLSFNGTNATNFVIDSPTQITATVPVGTTTGPITVTTPNGTGTSATNFTVVSPPAITSFSPSSGPVGTAVTIVGTGFSTTPANNAVYFDGVKATVSAASATQLVVSYPAGTTGFSDISVINLDNKLSALANKKFYTTFYNGGFVNYKTSAFAPKVDFTAVTNSLITFSNFSGMKTLNLYADFNLDGKPDYVQVGSTTTSVNPNTSVVGTISFDTKIVLNTGGYGVQTGDINNDGLLDLIVYDSTTVNIYKNTSTNNGTISFDTPIAVSLTNTAYRMYLKDMNNDGLLDLVTANNADLIYLLNNTPSGSTISFNTASPVSVTALANIKDFSVIDIDNNNQLDIIAIHSSSYSTRLNSSAFSALTTAITAGLNVVAGDLDKDNDIDFVTYIDGKNFNLFKNNGSNIFTTSTVVMGSSNNIAGALFLGEMNGNALPEFLGCETNGGNYIHIANNTSDSNLSFSTSSDFNSNTDRNNLSGTANDIDGDGRPDLTSFQENSDTFSVNRNIIGSPKITSFSPSSGTVGTTITITGSEFTGATAVTINGNPVTSFILNNSTSITAVVPSGSAGVITVTTTEGYGSSSTNFLYKQTLSATGTSAITELAACLNSPSAAQSFTVSGINLTSAMTVYSDDLTNIEFSLTGNSNDYSSSLSLTPTSGTVASTTVYVRQKSSALEVASATKTVTISSSFATSIYFSFNRVVNTYISPLPSTYTTARFYCQNTTPIDLSIPATGIGLTYQWYSNTTRSTTGATLIPGATSSTYTPLTSTVSALYYYCVVTGTCSTITSGFSGKITVIATSVGGTATATATALCPSATTNITLTGYTGTIQWQESADGITGWANVTGGSGATTATYTTPALTTTTYYRASVASGTCVNYSTVTSVSLNAATAITSQPSATAQNVCINGTPGDLSVTATGNGLNYQWYSNTTATTTGATLIPSATAAIYTPVTTMASTLYYYCVVSGSCGSVTSGFSGAITV